MIAAGAAAPGDHGVKFNCGQLFLQTFDTREMAGDDCQSRQRCDSHFPVGGRELRGSAHVRDKPFEMG
jgi:hypothetical protein